MTELQFTGSVDSEDVALDGDVGVALRVDGQLVVIVRSEISEAIPKKRLHYKKA